MNIYVSVYGDDGYPGTQELPFYSVARAKKEAERLAESEASLEEIRVLIQEGTYYLDEPLIFTAGDRTRQGASILFEGVGEVVLSGGVLLHLDWEPFQNGIYRARVPRDLWFDQLFVNGKRQIMARYPSFDPGARYYGGYAGDSFLKSRTVRYQNPKGAYLHAMHEGLWGDFQYEVTGRRQDGELLYIGGWQNNRSSHMHESIRYIEHVFEELTEEHEWFLDQENAQLYYKPPKGEDFTKAIFVGAVLKNLVSFMGDGEHPVRGITMKHLTFTHTARTFMEPMEPLLRSDWRVYRGGCVFLEGTRDISIEDCTFDSVGGNGVFISGYNRNGNVSGCDMWNGGGSCILLAGKSDCVRAPLFDYEANYDNYHNLDLVPGPKSWNYPESCRVHDNLLVRCGQFEKQAAGVSISMSHGIKVSHNTIYEVPRAGINICDGTFGGHVIEHNLVFDTVLETSDHGAFNSWGRDRYWDARYEHMKENLGKNPQLPFLDAISKTVLKNNCFACEHGWDIDLDDGSSNYEICQNLCLNGGIKNREGFKRKVHHNILLNNTYHPHVWFPNSKDEFWGNILFTEYADIGLNSWGEEFDYNMLHHEEQTGSARSLQEKSHMDEHSIYTKIEFVNASKGDFTVSMSKELEAVGFQNLEMGQFGVLSERLKKAARSPFGENYVIRKSSRRDDVLWEFEGVSCKNLKGLGEISATGMYQECGIYIRSIETDSSWYEAGIRANDVILSVDDRELDLVEDFIGALKGGASEFVLWRQQGKHIVKVKCNS